MFRRYKPARESYIPKGATKIADKLSDAVAYIIDTPKPYAVIFFGKQNRPVSHYLYRSTERRDAAVGEAFVSRRKSLAFKGELRAKRAAFVATYKVGDIFRTCWGYDQTNVEYFELIELKGKYGIFREIGQDRRDTGHMQGNCVPLPGAYLEPRHAGDDQGVPIRRLLQEHGIKIDDVRTARLVPGKTVAGVRVIEPSSWSAYH